MKEEIAEALGEVLPPGEVSKATAKVLQVFEHRESYRGPIPRPDDFERYEAILPGAADRILGMAEREQAHRIQWETTAIQAESRNSTLGLVLGIFALILLVAGAIGALLLREPGVAGAFVGTAALGLIPAFIRGRGLFNWFNDDDNSEDEPKVETPPKTKKGGK